MRWILVFMISACMLHACKTEPESNAKPVSAIEIWKDSLHKNPDSGVIAEKIIQYYRDEGNADSAIFYTKRQLSRDSLQDRFWYILGTLSLENADTALAVQSFENAARLVPDEHYFTSLGGIYAVQNNSEALKIADFIEKNNVENPRNAWYMRGIYYSYSGNKNEAIKWFDKCINRSYTDMDAYLEKGIAQYEMGNYAASVETLKKAVTIQNNFEAGYYFLGRSLEKLNKTDEAKDAYRSALLYDKNYTEAKEALERLKD